MTTASARVLLQMLRGKGRTGTAATQLDVFYRPQAEQYDVFRERLLPGRSELVARLDPGPGATIAEMGGGTARNLEHFGDRLATFDRVDVVDLCPALLEIARRRTARWSNVRVVEADAADYRPAGPLDCIYFSYSLSMMPDWRKALGRALASLAPDGLIGAVDFYVSSSLPPTGLARHDWATRTLLPHWFAHDGVMLGPERLNALMAATRQVYLLEARVPLPYLPGVSAPYFVYVGRKRT